MYSLFDPDTLPGSWRSKVFPFRSKQTNKQTNKQTKFTLTFGDGTTENVFIIRSGYSSRILEIKSVPIPKQTNKQKKNKKKTNKQTKQTNKQKSLH
jgi:hypothetical protein